MSFYICFEIILIKGDLLQSYLLGDWVDFYWTDFQVKVKELVKTVELLSTAIEFLIFLSELIEII